MTKCSRWIKTGKPATQVLDGDLEVWVGDLGQWPVLRGHLQYERHGYKCTHSVESAWLSQTRCRFAIFGTHRNLGFVPGGFSTVLQEPMRSRLLKVTGVGRPCAIARPLPMRRSLPSSADLRSIASCSACSGGEKVGGLGLGTDNKVTFNNVYAPRAGEYLMQVDSMTHRASLLSLHA